MCLCVGHPCGSLLLDTGTLVSHVTLRLLKPECALDESWCQEELSVAVKRAVTLLHSHTITSRAGKGEPGEGPDRVDRGRKAGEPCGGLTSILRASRGRSFRWSLPLLVLISSPHPLNQMDDF